MIFSRYIKEYTMHLRLERGFSNHSIESYTRDVEHFHQFIKQKNIENLTQITNQHIEDFIVYLDELLLASSTQSRMFSGLKSFFNYALDEHLISQNPCDGLSISQKGRKLPNVLSVEQIDKMVELIDLVVENGIRNRAIVELLYGSGLRVSELISIKLSNVFWHDEVIKITGKGNRQRFVPLTGLSFEYLKMYVENHRIQLTIQSQYEDDLFLNRRGKPLSRVMIFYIVREIAQKAGIGFDVSPHTFRHSFATHLVESGANLRVVQDLLGHKSIVTTELYTHLNQQFLKQEIEKFHPWVKRHR